MRSCSSQAPLDSHCRQLWSPEAQIISTIIFLASTTRGVSVLIFMPGLAGMAQEATRFLAPSCSTTQTRQAPTRVVAEK